MKHQEIKKLLAEASDPKCSRDRRNQICCMFGDASPARGPDGVDEIDTPAAGISVLLDRLYFDTLEKRPDYLPHLYPVFALACGDRDPDVIIADVDWSLI